ncbi:putative pantothenate transporter [Myxozyma melibiosi]|uniref:Pantothenate transporter n=1 Tax=Myxozyma melibiosi TaxID=54550 RepID=A0ABR1EZ75_9ASCO
MGFKDRFNRFMYWVQPNVTVTGPDDFRGRDPATWDMEEIKVRFADLIDDDEHTYQPNMVQRTLGQAWDTFRLPPKQRRYMQKLDANILLYALLSFFIKTLDNSNISNAYVSGMKEDLHLYGNERNLFSTMFNCGYLIGAIPSQFMLNRVRPSVWIPTCEFIWSGLVMSIAGCNSARPIYGIRFMIGFFESVAYPGLALVLGSWYRPSELAKRMELYDAAWAIASMFSGYIQAGVYSSMNGLAGFKGWQWLFVIDGIISFPIAWLGYYSIPDFPKNNHSLYLSELEREYSYVRMELVGRKAPKKLTMGRLVGMFKTWRPYAFLLPWCLFNVNDTTGYFNLWLDSLTKADGSSLYSTQQINLIPTGGYAISLVIGYLSANISDRVGHRWAFILHAASWCFLGNLLLAIWDIPFGLKYFAFFCPDIGYSSWGMMLAWSAEVFQDDAELRGMLPATGSTISYAINAWLPNVIFPTEHAPQYKTGKGYQIISGLLVLEMIGVLFMLFMWKREVRMKGRVINKYGLAVDAEEAVQLQTVGEKELQQTEKGLYNVNTQEVGGEKVKVIEGVEPVSMKGSDSDSDADVIKEKEAY